jgi:hypothetical protein
MANLAQVLIAWRNPGGKRSTAPRSAVVERQIVEFRILSRSARTRSNSLKIAWVRWSMPTSSN